MVPRAASDHGRALSLVLLVDLAAPVRVLVCPTSTYELTPVRTAGTSDLSCRTTSRPSRLIPSLLGTAAVPMLTWFSPFRSPAPPRSSPASTLPMVRVTRCVSKWLRLLKIPYPGRPDLWKVRRRVPRDRSRLPCEPERHLELWLLPDFSRQRVGLIIRCVPAILRAHLFPATLRRWATATRTAGATGVRSSFSPISLW